MVVASHVVGVEAEVAPSAVLGVVLKLPNLAWITFVCMLNDSRLVLHSSPSAILRVASQPHLERALLSWDKSFRSANTVHHDASILVCGIAMFWEEFANTPLQIAYLERQECCFRSCSPGTICD